MESTPMPLDALDPDSTAVRFDDSLDDRQTKTSAKAVRVVGLPETVEELRHVLVGDSGPVVTDPEMNVLIPRPSADNDEPTRLGEFDRVADQVLEHLEEAVAIGPDIRKVSLQIDLQLERGRRGELLMSIDAVGNRPPSLHDRRYDRESAALHARHVQEVLDQAVHSGCGALDRVYRRARRAGLTTASPEERRRRDNGSERISEIVSDKAENLVSRADRRLRDVVEESILQSQRRTSSKLLRHAHVLGPIPVSRAAPYGGHDRDEPIVRDDGDEHDGLDRDRVEQSEMLVILRNRAQKIGGDGRKEQRLLRVQHCPDGMVAAGQNVLEGFGKPRLRGDRRGRPSFDGTHPSLPEYR